jgi:D-galacturonate reductase
LIHFTHKYFQDKAAIDALRPGDAIVIFTPDSEHFVTYIPQEPNRNHIVGTHYPIALYAIERHLHVLVTKPATQKLAHHLALIEAAKKNGVICFVEHHKRSI